MKMGIGDWGFGIGPTPHSSLPNPLLKHYNYIPVNII